MMIDEACVERGGAPGNGTVDLKTFISIMEGTSWQALVFKEKNSILSIMNTVTVGQCEATGFKGAPHCSICVFVALEAASVLQTSVHGLRQD